MTDKIAIALLAIPSFVALVYLIAAFWLDYLWYRDPRDLIRRILDRVNRHIVWDNDDL